MIENGVYKTPFGKERIIVDPQNAQLESQLRRDYFIDIVKPGLSHETAAFSHLIKEIELFGSALYNASDALSDIDILIILRKRLTYNEHSGLFTTVKDWQRQHNCDGKLYIDVYYKEVPQPLSFLDFKLIKHESPAFDRFIHHI